jgi:hypothetical protein
MRYPDLFKPFDGTRWRMESGSPWHTFVSSKLTDDCALTFKTDANAEWAVLPHGAAPSVMLRFNLIDLPLRGRGHV